MHVLFPLTEQPWLVRVFELHLGLAGQIDEAFGDIELLGDLARVQFPWRVSYARCVW